MLSFHLRMLAVAILVYHSYLLLGGGNLTRVCGKTAMPCFSAVYALPTTYIFSLPYTLPMPTTPTIKVTYTLSL